MVKSIALYPEKRKASSAVAASLTEVPNVRPAAAAAGKIVRGTTTALRLAIDRQRLDNMMGLYINKKFSETAQKCGLIYIYIYVYWLLVVVVVAHNTCSTIDCIRSIESVTSCIDSGKDTRADTPVLELEPTRLLVLAIGYWCKR